MVLLSPRISPKLLAAIARLDDESLPIAETWRRVGRRADRLGFPRPSYDRIRVLVHRLRLRRRGREPADAVVAVAVRVRPPRIRVARAFRRRSVRGP
jgi:hypothetical protein